MNDPERPKRPPSVWIAQIVLTLFALVFIFLPLLVVGNIPVSLFILVYLFVMFVLLVILPIASVIGMAKRKSWGRWIGVGVLSFVFLISAISQILRPEGPVQRYEYSNTTQMISGVTAQVVLTGLFLLLILRLAFAKRVSRFFDSKTIDYDHQPGIAAP